MLSVTRVRRGASITFVKPNSFISAGRISSRYIRSSLGTYSAMVSCSAVDHGAALHGDADLLAVLVGADADAGWFVALGIEQHHVGGVDRGLLGDDPAGLPRGLRLLVPLHDVHAL